MRISQVVNTKKSALLCGTKSHSFRIPKPFDALRRLTGACVRELRFFLLSLRLQIPQQPMEGGLVAVVVFPVGEVRDEVFSDLPC